jgi:2',3'-cyclic-nucleotide 2'-phosphodiesterase (5'-nucleotidase family)
MRRIFSRVLAVLAITAVAALGADNSIGTWKVNIAKTKFTPAPVPVKSLTSVREAAPGGVKVANTGERADGSPINAGYTAKYDGSWAAVTGTGSPYDSIAVKQVNANTFTYEAKQTNGKYRASGRTVISSDGKTMTTKAKGTDANGAPMALTLVYEKQ